AQDPAALASLGRFPTPEVLGAHIRRLTPVLQAAGILVDFTRKGRSGRRMIRLQMGPTGTMSPDDDGQEDRSATPTSSPSASPPEAVSAIRAGVPDPPPPDADSAPVDSPGEASLVEPDPLSATPPRVVVFDRDACRREIRRTLWCSDLYGVAIRDHPAAA